ncbi:MAG: tetratricopeptide repeat protein [Desulfobacteraceae bacterium]|nr:MAG: tetratricopeptide repeat protein [Desulfobacteraceae bacterium]
MRGIWNYFVVVIIIILSALPGCREDQNVSFEEKGNREFDRQSYARAVNFWQQAIEESPDNARLYTKAGRAFLKLSRIDEAEKFLNHSIRLNPQNAVLQKDLIRICLIRGDHARALEKMKQYASSFEKDGDYFILQGDFYMISGELDKAERLYRKAVLIHNAGTRGKIKLAICLRSLGRDQNAQKIVSSLKPEMIEKPLNLLLLSDYFFLSGQLRMAEQCIQGALKHNPDSQILNIRLAQFYLQTSFRKKALETLRNLEKKYPENVSFKIMLADLYLSGRQVVQAETMLENAKEIVDDASRTNFNLLMGKCFLYKNQIPYAASYLKAVVSENPTLISATYLLGVAYFAGHQIKLAEKNFIRVLVLDPHHIDSLLMLSYIHYKDHAYDLSLDYSRQVLEFDKSNSRALTIKGLCLLELGVPKEAAPLFLKAFSLGKRVSALYFYGVSLEELGRLESAAEVFDKVLTINPELTDVVRRYASLLLELGQREKALEIARDIIEHNPANPFLGYTAGDLFYRLEQYEISQRILEKAISEGASHGHVYSLLAASYQYTGKHRDAGDLLLRCTFDFPNYCQGWIDLAVSYMNRGQKKAALQVLDAAYRKNPDSPAITGNLAWLLLENDQDVHKALDLARKAYEKSPDNPAIADTLGWAYYLKGAYSQAEWMLEQAEALAPDKAIVKYHRAMLLASQGKTTAAKKCFQAALAHKLPEHLVDRIPEGML